MSASSMIFFLSPRVARASLIANSASPISQVHERFVHDFLLVATRCPCLLDCQLRVADL